MTRRLVETGDDSANDANLSVILGLASGMIDEALIDALVELLRSDYPIQPQLRDILADAIAGEHPVLSARIWRGKRGPSPKELPFVTGMRRALELLEIGKFIAQHPAASDKLESAVQAAMDEFGVVRSVAFNALSYWREAEDLKSNGFTINP